MIDGKKLMKDRALARCLRRIKRGKMRASDTRQVVAAISSVLALAADGIRSVANAFGDAQLALEAFQPKGESLCGSA